MLPSLDRQATCLSMSIPESRHQAWYLKGNLPQRKQNFVKKKSDLWFRHYIVLTVPCFKKFKKADHLGLWKNPLTIPCVSLMQGTSNTGGRGGQNNEIFHVDITCGNPPDDGLDCIPRRVTSDVQNCPSKGERIVPGFVRDAQTRSILPRWFFLPRHDFIFGRGWGETISLGLGTEVTWKFLVWIILQ